MSGYRRQARSSAIVIGCVTAVVCSGCHNFCGNCLAELDAVRSLFIQTRGVLKKELSAQLRTARRMRHPKSHNAKSGQGHILDMGLYPRAARRD